MSEVSSLGGSAAETEVSAEDDQWGSRPPTGAELSHDAFFEALSNRRRRYVLHYLKQRTGEDTVDLADLSAQITAWERGVEADGLSYADRKSVHTSLSQFHVPKLDELGFVRYDRERSSVELTDRAADVNVYLETVSGRELPWGPYLLFLASVLSAAVLGSMAGVPVLTGLPKESLLVFVAVTFLSSSAVFTYDTWTKMRVGADGPPPEVDG
ncbi:hypothetical protein SAMN04488063_3534 [Halopelagius inordinatus]|uniref:DUF7344 domain-containing protein n=1 Tax=Halopelagius inordinatus TaxID=553467 RepID=A0A1I2WK83_9EURY|nr:transcriptional regulator [Halopelagius inordinatus]SFG99981.1 hypothetical protein SAMN04488063_3534 [Halopelagius inordinatus]